MAHMLVSYENNKSSHLSHFQIFRKFILYCPKCSKKKNHAGKEVYLDFYFYPSLWDLNGLPHPVCDVVATSHLGLI